MLTGEATQYADDRRDTPLTIHICSGGDADFLYYDDAHDGYRYESGEYFTIRFHWNDTNRRLTISTVQGDYFNTVSMLSFLVEVDSRKCTPFNYDGEKMIIRCE